MWPHIWEGGELRKTFLVYEARRGKTVSSSLEERSAGYFKKKPFISGQSAVSE